MMDQEGIFAVFYFMERNESTELNFNYQFGRLMISSSCILFTTLVLGMCLELIHFEII